MKHYKRVWRHGDAAVFGRIYRNASPTCSIEDCDLPTVAKGFCCNHYALNRRNGAPKIIQGRNRTYIKKGYRYVYVGNCRCIQEHRVVMSKFLNRDIEPYELVHHINGDKLDNRIENLEIISNSEHAKIHVKGRARAPGGYYASK